MISPLQARRSLNFEKQTKHHNLPLKEKINLPLNEKTKQLFEYLQRSSKSQLRFEFLENWQRKKLDAHVFPLFQTYMSSAIWSISCLMRGIFEIEQLMIYNFFKNKARQKGNFGNVPSKLQKNPRNCRYSRTCSLAIILFQRKQSKFAYIN